MGTPEFSVPSLQALIKNKIARGGDRNSYKDSDMHTVHYKDSFIIKHHTTLTIPKDREQNVKKNSFYVDGHFPGNPVLPGVLIVEAFGQAAAALTAHGIDKKEYDNKLVFLMSVEKARFRNPVIPDCKLELNIEAIRSHGRVWKYKGEAFVEGKKMADAQWSATIVDRK